MTRYNVTKGNEYLCLFGESKVFFVLFFFSYFFVRFLPSIDVLLKADIYA